MTVPPIDVTDLLGHPGAARRVSVSGTVADLGTSVAAVPEDAPVEADLLLESVVEGIVVSGTLRGRWHLRCARCLDEFDAPFALEVTELFVADPQEDADEYPLEPHGAIDPEQMLRDAIGVELPFSPLCRPDCAGLCPVCGGNRNLGQCPGNHPQRDPRWAPLGDLLEQIDN